MLFAAIAVCCEHASGNVVYSLSAYSYAEYHTALTLTHYPLLLRCCRSVRFLMLEDLTFPFREGRPCVLDVKMGTRQYRANASPEKEQRQRLKSSTTTTGQYGLRLNGMQVSAG
jgi:Inositol polyphosphate kinase